jgi:hypothetical protein
LDLVWAIDVLHPLATRRGGSSRPGDDRRRRDDCLAPPLRA